MVDTIEVVALSAKEGAAPAAGDALTVRFKVEKSLTPTPNKAELHVLNLNGDSRARIASKEQVPVEIEAGYEDGTSVIFLGKLRTARAIRDGADIIMSLASSDGGAEYQKARFSATFKKGTETSIVLRALVKALGVLEGNIAAAIATIEAHALGQMFAAGACFHGQASAEMTNLCRSVGLTWSIQDGKLQFLNLRESLPGDAILLSPDTGLVDTPSVDPKGIVHCRMLMAPDVVPGRLLVLKSENITGQYRIEKTTHSGDTRGTDWYVDIEGRRY